MAKSLPDRITIALETDRYRVCDMESLLPQIKDAEYKSRFEASQNTGEAKLAWLKLSDGYKAAYPALNRRITERKATLQMAQDKKQKQSKRSNELSPEELLSRLPGHTSAPT